MSGTNAPRYYFEAGVIRLSQKHYEQWKRVYRHLDLDAELYTLGHSEWLAGRDDWYWPVRGVLNKRNRMLHQQWLKRMRYNGIEGVL